MLFYFDWSHHLFNFVLFQSHFPCLTSSSEFTDPLTEGLQLLLLVTLHPRPDVTGTVAEMQGVVEAAELGVVMPAQVVALVGDVALVHPGFQVPQIQPHLVVLVEKTLGVRYSMSLTMSGSQNAPETIRKADSTCNQGWLRVLSTLYLFLMFTCSRLLIKSIAVRKKETS